MNNKKYNQKNISKDNQNQQINEIHWFLLSISASSKDLQEKVEILKDKMKNDLKDVLIDVKIPGKIELIQNDNKDIELKKVNLVGYLLLKINAEFRNKHFIIPYSISSIMKHWNAKFITLGKFPKPLKMDEVNNLITREENNDYPDLLKKKYNKKNNKINNKQEKLNSIKIGDIVVFRYQNSSLEGKLIKIIKSRSKTIYYVNVIFFSNKVTLFHIKENRILDVISQ